jgi:DNA-binding transcriptional regulator LsrR (DeoR family)
MRRIAVLARLGMKQEEIAAHENTSLSTVARHLRSARQSGILEDVPLLRLPLAELDRVCATITDPRLTRLLESRLAPEGVARVRVIPATHGRPVESARRVAVIAADLLAADLGLAAQNHHVLAFTGGWMSRLIVDLADLPALDPALLTVVALGGERLLAPTAAGHAPEMRSSANRLVADIALRLGVPEHQVWRFGVPPVLPRPLLRDERSLAVLRREIDADPTVRGILGSRGRARPLPLIERIDTVFTTVRVLGPDPEGGEASILDLSPTEIEELTASGVPGEWNGHLLVARDADAATRRVVAEENRLATGASPADLKRVAERARPPVHRGRGVIVVASGPRVAAAVLALITAGAVNELVIGSDTAVAMLAGLGVECAPGDPLLG